MPSIPEALWWLALTTGMRAGELLALRWADVDLANESIHVVASLTRITGQEPRLAEPKTAKSRRQVDLSAGALNTLWRQRSATSSIHSRWTTFVINRPSPSAAAVRLA